MSKFTQFEDIESWKKARKITNKIYDLSDKGSFGRDFSLKDQIRSASVSIMSNIAEGFEREGNREFMNFLSIAKGSCAETRSQLYIALDREYLSNTEFEEVNAELLQTGRLIGGLMAYLNRSDFKGSKFKRQR